MVALSVVMLTLLAVYFFLHRRQQVPEIETLHRNQCLLDFVSSTFKKKRERLRKLSDKELASEVVSCAIPVPPESKSRRSLP